MPGCDPRIIIHLAKAQAEMDAAMALLASPSLELPAGVETPAPVPACTHPQDKIHKAFGGRRWCGACGADL